MNPRWMLAAAPLLVLAGALGHRATSVGHARAPGSATPPLLVESCGTTAEQAAHAPAPAVRVGTLTKMHVSTVDIAAGHEPSASRPGGTVYIATVTHDAGGPHPALFEWDVSRARTLSASAIEFKNDKVMDNGSPTDARVAAGPHHVFVATTVHRSGQLLIDAFDREGVWVWRTARGARAFEDGGLEVSMAAGGGWLAIAHLHDPRGPGVMDLALLATPTPGEMWLPVRERYLATEPLPRGSRASALAFVEERLFVAEQPSPTETRVSELALPSLKPLRTFTNQHPASAEGGRTQLTSDRRRLYLLDRGTLVTLDTALQEQARVAISTDEVAIGPSGEVLTTVGPASAPGVRGDRVPFLDREASCTPAWSGPYPMLACAVDMEGALIARFPASGAAPSSANR